MKPIEGRLQTAEHILAKIIEDKISDAKVGIAKFEEESGILEIITQTNLRNLNQNEIQNEVNHIIKKELSVHKSVKKREDAKKEVDLSKVPSFVRDIRIVEIDGFDKRPCRDPHVDNTSEIGIFRIFKIKRVGNNRYRFTFRVDSKN